MTGRYICDYWFKELMSTFQPPTQSLFGERVISSVFFEEGVSLAMPRKSKKCCLKQRMEGGGGVKAISLTPHPCTRAWICLVWSQRVSHNNSYFISYALPFVVVTDPPQNVRGETWRRNGLGDQRQEHLSWYCGFEKDYCGIQRHHHKNMQRLNSSPSHNNLGVTKWAAKASGKV